MMSMGNHRSNGKCLLIAVGTKLESHSQTGIMDSRFLECIRNWSLIGCWIGSSFLLLSFLLSLLPLFILFFFFFFLYGLFWNSFYQQQQQKKLDISFFSQGFLCAFDFFFLVDCPSLFLSKHMHNIYIFIYYLKSIYIYICVCVCVCVCVWMCYAYIYLSISLLPPPSSTFYFWNYPTQTYPEPRPPWTWLAVASFNPPSLVVSRWLLSFTMDWIDFSSSSSSYVIYLYSTDINIYHRYLRWLLLFLLFAPPPPTFFH